MKKFALIFSIIVVLVLAGVGVYSILPKENTTPTGQISLEVENVTLKVDEEVKVEYSVSTTKAVIVMEIENVSIAELRPLATGFYVKGLKEGSSIISVTASYGAKKVTKTATIVVKSKEEGETDNPAPIDDNPEPDDPNDQDETPNIPIENKPVVEFLNLFKCEYSSKTFTIDANKLALFSIVCNENIESISLFSQSKNLVITLANDIGNNTYKILGLQTGEYVFILNINGHAFEYNVVVK